MEAPAPSFVAALPARRAAPRGGAKAATHRWSSPAGRELAALLALAAPLAAANLGLVLLGAVEAAVVGRLGGASLGALAVGSTVYFTIAVPATGLLLGFEPLIAQAIGAGERTRARHLARGALAVALAAGLPLAALGALASLGLEAVGIQAATAHAVRGYLAVRLLGLLPHLAFVALRLYAQATGRAPAVFAAIVAANLVELPLATLLVFGGEALNESALPALGATLGGLPAGGLAGAAAASGIATTVAAVVLARRCGLVSSAWGLSRAASAVSPACWSRAWDRARLGPALTLGAPLAVAMLAEQMVFTVVGVFVAGLAVEILAAHQIALTIAGGLYMVPVAIGAAAAVRVGAAVGRGDLAAARRVGAAAAGVAALAMAVAAVVLLVAPRSLAACFTGDAAVLSEAAPLVASAALFLLVDGVQGALGGALRGAGDTRFVLIATLGGHYGVGLPLGCALAGLGGHGALGLWWGLTAGLAVIAVVHGMRFAALSGRVSPGAGRLSGDSPSARCPA